MYTIVTSKPGVYVSEIPADTKVVQTYKYMFSGHCKAIFQIIELEDDVKVKITELDPPHIVNVISSKFLGSFGSEQAAQNEIRHLVYFSNLDVSLDPSDPSCVEALVQQLPH